MPKITEIKSTTLPADPNFLFEDIPGVNPQFFPGVGIVFTFGEADTPRLEQFVIGYHRPNPDANNKMQLNIAIGGNIADKTKPVIEALKERIGQKTNGADPLLVDSVTFSAEQAAAYYNLNSCDNMDSSDNWNMSFVYLTQHIELGFDELKAFVTKLNSAATDNLQADPNTKFNVNFFEIYKLRDILNIINRNARLAENEKVGISIVNQLSGETNEVVVFDDYGTQALFAKEVLAIKQTINGEDVYRKANAAVVLYCDGYVILQKNTKGKQPEWASVGGKVDVTDSAAINNFDLATGLERQLIDLLRKQFKADKDATMAIFAYAAIREAVEEVGGGKKEFIYNALINGDATLVRVDRDSFGIPEANKKFWTEQFYLDFGVKPITELLDNLQASGKPDCTEIVTAPIGLLVTKKTRTPGIMLTTYIDLPVRHTTAVVAKRIDELRQRIANLKENTDANNLFKYCFDDKDPLKNADLGSGLFRIFLPQGQTPEPKNWRVILGKRFNGQLKLSVGGAVEQEDESFIAAARREGIEEHFNQLPIAANCECIASDVYTNFKSGKRGTDGIVYFSFLTVDTQYTNAELDAAVKKMNKFAPVYFALNKFLTDLAAITPENQLVQSIKIKNRALDFLDIASQLSLRFSSALVLELMSIGSEGKSTMNAKDLEKFTEDNVRTYSEYSYFINMSYLDFKQAFESKQSVACITPSGSIEVVPLFRGEADAVAAFMPKFEAKCLAMMAPNTTLGFANVKAGATNLSMLAGVGIVAAAAGALAMHMVHSYTNNSKPSL